MKNHFLPVLKNRNFLKLWVSQIFSQFTINLTNFVLITKIFEKTGSSIAVSFLWISYALPAILLLPLSGPLVDVVNRRLVLFVTNLLQAITMVLFIPLGNTFYHIFPIVFLYSALNQFYIPAEAASIPDLVPEKHYSAANSLFLITSQATFVLGFGAGGPLLTILGPYLPFALGSFLLLIAALATAFLPDQRSRDKITFTASLTHFWEEFIVGYNYIKSERGVLFPIGILVGGQLLLSIMSAIFPLIGKDILGSTIRQTGITLIVPVGLGALLGSYLIPRLSARYRRRQIIETGMSLLIIGVLTFALIVPLSSLIFPTFRIVRLLLGVPTIFVLGIAAVLVFIPSQTIVQERTPGVLRGRILSASYFLMTAASIIPLIFASAITEFLGIKTTLVLLTSIVALGLYYSRKAGDNYILKA